MTAEDAYETAHPLPWRTGRRVGRTIYDRNDVLIGVMDTPDLAATVVDAVNDMPTPQKAGDPTCQSCGYDNDPGHRCYHKADPEASS